MGDIGTKVLQVPMRGSVNTGVDKRAIDPPDFTWAQNVVLTEDGVLRKRRGYESIGIVDPRTALAFDRCDALAEYDGNLVAFAGQGDIWYRTQDGDDLIHSDVGHLPAARTVSRTVIARNTDTAYGIPRADIAYEPNSGILVACYNTGSLLFRGVVFDRKSGAVRFFSTASGFGVQRFRLVNAGQYIFMVMPGSFVGEIRINRLDCNNPLNLATNPNGGPQFTDYDIATGAIGVSPFSATQFFLAYSRGTSIFVAKCGITGVSVSSVVIAENVAGPIACRYVGSILWVAWQRAGGDIRMAGYDSSLSTVVASFTVLAAAAQAFTIQLGARDATSVLIAWDNGSDCRVRAVSTAGALLLTERSFVADHIESGFVEVDGRSWLVLAETSALQGGSYLCEVTTVSVPIQPCISSATLAPLLSAALSTATPGETVSSVVQAADGAFFFALPVKVKVTLSGGDLFTYATPTIGVDLFELDLSTGKRYRTVQHGGEMVVAAGTPCVFDGRDMVEVGFLRFPEQATLAFQFTTGGFMDPGVYQYCLTYRRDDFKGRTWRSAPSLPFTVTVPAGTNTNRVSLRCLNLAFTRASVGPDSGVVIEVWRTEKNESGPFFYCQSIVNQPTTTGLVAITDGLADASINTGETLYTDGGSLSNYAPPSCTFAVSHGEVLIVDNAEDGSLWQSKPLVAGEGFGFNGALTYRLASSEKPVMGVSMDDKCIIFTEHEIHMLIGTPADDKGVGGFQTQRLSSPVGCVDPRSVVLGKDGVYFLSERGIELLTRGLEVLWIGADVAYWVDNYGECIFAQAMPGDSEIRFGFITPGAGISEDHQVLRLNTERRSQNHPFGSWTTEKAGMGVPRAGAVAGGLMHIGYSDGRLFRESTTVFTDNGVFSPSTVRLMLKPAGMQGFVRLRRLSILAERKSSHKLTIYLRYNYADDIGSTRTWKNAEIASLPREQLPMLVDIQKAQAFEVEIQDAADTNGPGPDTGEGCWLSGLAMELAVQERTFARAMALEAKK